MMFKLSPSGVTSNIAFKIEGLRSPAWNSFMSRTPRRWSCQHSFEVKADGTARMPRRLHSSTKPIGSMGDKANEAPSAAARSRSHTVLSITVPTPSTISLGRRSRSWPSTVAQSVLSMVISKARHPISASSRPRRTATSGEPLFLIMAKTPARPRLFSVASIFTPVSSGTAEGVPCVPSAATCPSHASSLATSCALVTVEKSPLLS
mmetsp:Transcript_9207/g.25758  ORF Transcript_9207/g.25758 Transcript_9207/m.25758 type:complete len:206 (-) Transcript_9207:1048-1665(-)